MEKLFNHGDKVTCYYGGKQIDDGKISIQEEQTSNGTERRMFLCTNHIGGNAARESFGFRCTWEMPEKSMENISIYNLVVLGRKMSKEEIEYCNPSIDLKISY